MQKDYSIEEIQELTRQVATLISDDQSHIWGTSEWNICHHLALGLANKIKDYDVDVELVKEDRRRPDIVIHKRGHNDDNLAAFQVKINPKFLDIEKDLKKMRETFLAAPYNYKYGIFVSIGQLPKPVPEFEPSSLRFVEVYGWRAMTKEEWEKKSNKPFDL